MRARLRMLTLTAVFSLAAAGEIPWRPEESTFRSRRHYDQEGTDAFEKFKQSHLNVQQRLRNHVKEWAKKQWWASRGTPPAYQDFEPTQQPPTRDQDRGICAVPALPDVINLKPQQTSWFARQGRWYGKMGAELARWKQNRFRIDYLNLDYEVGLKPWFTAQVLRNPEKELEHMNIVLPPPEDESFFGEKHTIVYRDCELTPMYISRELGRYSRRFEIFNQLGQLVARGHPSKMVHGQIYFKDISGLPFALAGSPSIALAVDSSSSETSIKHDRWEYDFDHWQVWFMHGYNSLTYLKEPINRWVIAAVVQEHAVLGALIQNPSSAAPYMAYLGLCFVVVILLVGLCLLAGKRIFLLVYPPKPQKENPFMTMDIGGHPYGSFALRHQRPRV